MKPCLKCKTGKRLYGKALCYHCFLAKNRERKAVLKARKAKRKEEAIWNLTRADREFSKFIINRDKKCQRCNRSDRQLQNSHYWARQWYSTRFDPDNCITLCAWCHTFDKDNWEKDRLGEYMAFMINKLGVEGFQELKDKHYVPKKKREAIIEVMNFLKYMEILK
jgi:hypothetical protein